MSSLQLFYWISGLPKEVQVEIVRFVQQLVNQNRNPESTKPRQFGCAKGRIRMMPGFDDPLTDFSDYS